MSASIKCKHVTDLLLLFEDKGLVKWGREKESDDRVNSYKVVPLFGLCSCIDTPQISIPVASERSGSPI